MNKEYIQSEDKFIVNTDKGLEKRERLNNTTEILKVENNIEEMEDIKNDIENKEFFNYSTIQEFFVKKYMSILFATVVPFSVLFMVLGVLVPNLMTAAFITSLVSAFCCTVVAANIVISKSHKLHNSMHEKANECLDKELENENQKLNELNNESKVLDDNDLGILGETIKIDRTKLIEDLKLKLELIGDYELNNKKYIKYFENGALYEKLSNEGYSKTSISLIEELIKNEMGEKTNEKVLKLEKK